MSNQNAVLFKIMILAGPNGAGKTTFAEEYLPKEADCIDFINADLIARGLSPFEPARGAYQAGKIMLSQIVGRIKKRESFAFETTLSGLGYTRRIPYWRSLGYHVKIVFLSLRCVELALARVKSRVVQGGHDIPEFVVRRRFSRGLVNFEKVYRSLVDSWALYDNSGLAPKLIREGGDL